MGERLNRLVWIGVAAATAGAALIAGRPEGAGSPLGVTLSLLSLLVVLGWVVALKRAPEGPTPMAVPAATIVIAALAILPAALLLHGVPKLALSPTAWAGVIGQGLFSTLLATVAWQYGATRVGSATAGVFINIEPLLGATLGVLLFGDRLTLGLAVGGLMILVGSLVVVLGERAASAQGLAHDAPATPA
jgi:drug/metabolite transporter (DMT)-like permease